MTFYGSVWFFLGSFKLFRRYKTLVIRSCNFMLKNASWIHDPVRFIFKVALFIFWNYFLMFSFRFRIISCRLFKYDWGSVSVCVSFLLNNMSSLRAYFEFIIYADTDRKISSSSPYTGNTVWVCCYARQS